MEKDKRNWADFWDWWKLLVVGIIFILVGVLGVAGLFSADEFGLIPTSLIIMLLGFGVATLMIWGLIDTIRGLIDTRTKKILLRFATNFIISATASFIVVVALILIRRFVFILLMLFTVLYSIWDILFGLHGSIRIPRKPPKVKPFEGYLTPPDPQELVDAENYGILLGCIVGGLISFFIFFRAIKPL